MDRLGLSRSRGKSVCLACVARYISLGCLLTGLFIAPRGTQAEVESNSVFSRLYGAWNRTLKTRDFSGFHQEISAALKKPRLSRKERKKLRWLKKRAARREGLKLSPKVLEEIETPWGTTLYVVAGGRLQDNGSSSQDGGAWDGWLKPPNYKIADQFPKLAGRLSMGALPRKFVPGDDPYFPYILKLPGPEELKRIYRRDASHKDQPNPLSTAMFAEDASPERLALPEKISRRKWESQRTIPLSREPGWWHHDMTAHFVGTHIIPANVADVGRSIARLAREILGHPTLRKHQDLAEVAGIIYRQATDLDTHSAFLTAAISVFAEYSSDAATGIGSNLASDSDTLIARATTQILPSLWSALVQIRGANALVEINKVMRPAEHEHTFDTPVSATTVANDLKRLMALPPEKRQGPVQAIICKEADLSVKRGIASTRSRPFTEQDRAHLENLVSAVDARLTPQISAGFSDRQLWDVMQQTVLGQLVGKPRDMAQEDWEKVLSVNLSSTIGYVDL